MIVILTEIEDSVPYIKDKLKESRWLGNQAYANSISFG